MNDAKGASGAAAEEHAAAPRVGFIGLGHQGAPIAAAIAAAGFPTTLWARRPEALVPFRGTPARVADSVADLAANSDIVGVCVLDDAAVDDVLGGTGQLVAHMRPGTTVIVHSTVSPHLCRRWARIAAERGVGFLDAPVSSAGTSDESFTSARTAAASSIGRALAVLVGGDPAVFERCRPVLESFGSAVRLLGPVGAGQHAKLLNNALVYAQLAMTCSALAAGRGVGIDPTALIEILQCSSSRSHAMDIIASHSRPLDVDKMLSDMAAQTGSLVRKDVGQVLDTAAGEDIDLGTLRSVLPETMALLAPKRLLTAESDKTTR